MNLIERIVPRAQINEGMTIVLTGLIIGIAVNAYGIWAIEVLRFVSF